MAHSTLRSLGTKRRDIAEANGGVTLEKILEERGISLPDWDNTNPAVVQVWQETSSKYTEGALGTVRAVIGENLRADNVWESAELNTLKNNPRVDKIVKIGPHSRAETLLWSRP